MVNSVSKYKLLLVVLKYLPLILSICYLCNTIISYFDLQFPVLSHIGGVSLLTWIYLYLSTVVFKFCIYQLLQLYYIFVTDIINIIDYYIGIPISDFKLLMLHSSITLIFILTALYFHVKHTKKLTTKNS